MARKYNPFIHRGLSSFRALEDLFPGSDNYLRYMAGRVPIINDLAKFYDSSKWMSDYMRNRNVSWSDVKYPSLVGQGGSISPAMRLFEPDVDSYQRLYDDHYVSAYHKDWTSDPMYY